MVQHAPTLVATVAASLSLALALGFLAHRLRLPPLVGYLVAGVLIGPATPGFVADVELSGQLAEIGAILLMFGVGLHFSFESLAELRRISVPGALVQMAVATALGAGAARAWGWTASAALLFGLALSVASTVVLLRALEQRGALDSINGRIAVGWLVVEDLAMVLVLVLLPALTGGTGGGDAPIGGLLQATVATLGKVSLFVALMLVVGRRALPRLLWNAGKTGLRELFTLSVIAAAVGAAYAAARLFGVSLALGAFFAGMVLRESDLSQRAAEESLPLRDAFSVLFFVSMGMLLDPNVLTEQPLRLLVVLGIVILGKTLVALLIVLAFGYPLNTALTVSAGLAQIGEFSFILSGLGVSLGILPHEAHSLILAGAFLSISLNHWVFEAIEPAQRWVRSRSRLAQALERPADPLSTLPGSVRPAAVTDHVVLVGYGRVGRRIGEALAETGVAFVVAEENRELVEGLRARGLHAVAGDAAQAEVLIQAHIARAAVLVIAASDVSRSRRMVEFARMLNPRVRILIRAHGDEEAALLRGENAGTVFASEELLSSAMLREVLELRR